MPPASGNGNTLACHGEMIALAILATLSVIAAVL